MKKRMSSFVEDYKENRPKYEAFTQKVEDLVRTLIEEAGLSIHSVTSRTKDIRSFERKVSDERKSYKQISEITDLSGVRIICYFLDQVDKVAEIIAKNFVVLPEHSIDKRKTLDPDRFGYLSLHYVVKLSDERVRLPEYKRYEGLLCEIQIRSILQHTWAEIEHDLGYKSIIGVPREIRRRFSRLAGLLELADEEFNNVRKEIDIYSQRVETEISSAPQEVLIDNVTLKSYILRSTNINKLDKVITENLGGFFVNEVGDIEGTISELKFLDIETINDLDRNIKLNESQIINYAKKWIAKPLEQKEEISRGISIFYLCYLLVGKTGDINIAKEYLDYASIGSSDERNQIANKIIEVYKRVTES